MIYFAYGSNLHLESFLVTCPGAVAKGAARLDGHRLCFPRWSTKRSCAVAGIAPDPAGQVWGALYALSETDWRALDRREGYDPGQPVSANRYARTQIDVVARDGGAVRAQTYVALPEENPGTTSRHYLGLILDGGRYYEFPADYLGPLKTMYEGLAS